MSTMPTVSRVAKLLSIVVLAASLLGVSHAQVDSASDVGRAQLNYGYDNIDLSNLYVGLTIPVFSKPGSPALPFSYYLTGYPNVAPGLWGQTETNLGLTGVFFGGLEWSTAIQICGSPAVATYSYSGFEFVDASGAVNSFGSPLSGGTATLSCENDHQSFRTANGSLYLTVAIDTSYHMTYTVTNSQGTILVNAARGGGYFAKGWQPSTNLGLNSVIFDQSGNMEITNSCGTNENCTSGTTYPAFTPTVGGTTTDGQLTWLNLGPPSTTIRDTAGNTSSVAVTNLIASTMFTGGGSLGTGTSRDYTKSQVWTYTDAMGLTALTETTPAQIASGNPYVALSNIQQTMAYKNAAGTTENVYMKEAYMGQTPPTSGCDQTLNGPAIIGVNSTLDANGVIHGSSFATPNVYSFYPTAVDFPDGSVFGFQYETAAGGKTATSAVTTVTVTGDVAQLQLSSLSATTASPVTKFVTTVVPNPPNIGPGSGIFSSTTVITIKGTNPWKVGNIAQFAWMSSANINFDGFQFTVSAVTSTTVQFTSITSASPGTYTTTESQGYIVAPIGTLGFSGFSGASFLNNTTPLQASWGPIPYRITQTTTTTNQATYNYATAGGVGFAGNSIVGSYTPLTPPVPSVGEVIVVTGTNNSGGNLNGSVTVTSVGNNLYGPYFTVAGTYTAASSSNVGLGVMSTQTGVTFVTFPFEHATYSGSETAAVLTNNAAITGRMSQINLPAGGYIQYAYSGGNNNSGINCPDASYATLTRTTNDGTTTFTHQPAGGALQTSYRGGTFPISTVYEGTPLVSSLVINDIADAADGTSYYSPFGLVAALNHLTITGSSGAYTAVVTYEGQTANLTTSDSPPLGNQYCLVIVNPVSGPWTAVTQTDLCENFAADSTSGNTITNADFTSGTGTFDGAITGYLFRGPVADPYWTGTPLIFYPAIGPAPSQTQVVDAAGNEAMYTFSGVREVDQKIFTGTPTNVIVNSNFQLGALTDWTSDILGSLAVTGSVSCVGSCPSGSVAYTDQGGNEDTWGTGSSTMNATNGTLGISLGVTNTSTCCSGGYPLPPGTTTQTATITGISITAGSGGSTIIAQVSGSLPSNYTVGRSVVVTLPAPQNILNGTFTITAINTTSSPQTFSWVESTTYNCNQVVETIDQSFGQAVANTDGIFIGTDVYFYITPSGSGTTFPAGYVVNVAGTQETWIGGPYPILGAGPYNFLIFVPGEAVTWSTQPDRGTGTFSPCTLLSSGTSSVTVTNTSAPNIASVQVTEVNGTYTLLVTTTGPPSGVRIGTTQFTFSGMTSATWLNGLTLTATTWDGQNVFGFAVPSGAPEPYGPTAETTAFANCTQTSLPTVYTSDWVYVTNLNMSTVPSGSAITGVEFNDKYIAYDATNATTLTAQLVNNGVRVGTARPVLSRLQLTLAISVAMQTCGALQA